MKIMGSLGEPKKLAYWFGQMVTGKDLISWGLKPGPEFAQILEHCKTLDRAEAEAFARSCIKEKLKGEHKGPAVKSGSVLEWLLSFPFCPNSIEGKHLEASNSEKRRWLEQKAVLINGFQPGPDASMDNQFPIWQLVFFPNANRKTTMVDDTPNEKATWFDVAGKILKE